MVPLRTLPRLSWPTLGTSGLRRLHRTYGSRSHLIQLTESGIYISPVNGDARHIVAA